MRRVLKWGGITIASLIGLILIVIGAVYVISGSHMNKVYSFAVKPIEIPTNQEMVARGKHLSIIKGCVDCHGEGLSGKVFVDEPILGRLSASNLTRGKGGVGTQYKDEDWDRAIRHGVGYDGKPLLIMPSQEYANLSDADLSALVAYIKSLEPADTELPPSYAGPMARILYVAGQFPLLSAEVIDHEERPEAPPVGVTAEYGKYLATVCMGCHGENYNGRQLPGSPVVSRNLTPHETGLKAWSEEDFFRALRQGKRPDGTDLKPDMPWKLTAQMTDDELRAMWLFFRSLPAQPAGGTEQ